MRLVPATSREGHAFAAAGAMAQDVYLYCASAGLARGLGTDQQLLLAQTVGRPRDAAAG